MSRVVAAFQSEDDPRQWTCTLSCGCTARRRFGHARPKNVACAKHPSAKAARMRDSIQDGIKVN